MTGKLEQTYNTAWNGSTLTVTLTNTHRELTNGELIYIDLVLEEAEYYINMFYPDGTVRNPEHKKVKFRLDEKDSI